jgi:hypothetical protein
MADRQVLEAIRKRKGQGDFLPEPVTNFLGKFSNFGVPEAVPMSSEFANVDERDAYAQAMAGQSKGAIPANMGNLKEIERPANEALGLSITGERDPAAAKPKPMASVPPGLVGSLKGRRMVMNDGPDPMIAKAIAERASGRDEMAAAQKASNVNSMFAEIGDASGDLGAAIAGVKRANPNGWAGLKKSANAPVEQLEERQKFGRASDLMDPNSVQSNVARNLAKAQLKAAGQDPNQVDGMSAQDLKDFMQSGLTALESSQARKQNAQLMASFRDTNLQDKQDFRAHQAVLAKLKGDKTLTETANRSNNVANALRNAEATGKITAQDFHDLQQLLIANMGMTGGASAAERMQRQADTLGVKASELQQFLTGNPQDVGKGNPLFDRFKHLGSMEVKNFRKRAEDRVKALTAGNEGMYRRNTENAEGLKAVTDQMLGQMATYDPEAGASPLAYADPEKEKAYQAFKASQGKR